METLQKDPFPFALQQAAMALFDRSTPSAILLKQPSADAIMDCLSISCSPVPALLHPNEIVRARNYRLNKRRAEFLTGRIATKIALKNFWTSQGLKLPAPLCHIEIINDANGRPIVSPDCLKDVPAPEISISHGGEYAASLVAQSPCGIDVQQQRKNLLRVREKYCSPVELQVLAELLPGTTPISRLLLLWTAKEAAKKALSYRRMPGFLELELMPSAQILPKCHSFTLAVRVRDNAHLPDFVKVLATTFADYGLAICILTKEQCYARTAGS